MGNFFCTVYIVPSPVAHVQLTVHVWDHSLIFPHVITYMLTPRQGVRKNSTLQPYVIRNMEETVMCRKMGWHDGPFYWEFPIHLRDISGLWMLCEFVLMLY